MLNFTQLINGYLASNLTACFLKSKSFLAQGDLHKFAQDEAVPVASCTATSPAPPGLDLLTPIAALDWLV